jgi:hypothetical protein
LLLPGWAAVLLIKVQELFERKEAAEGTRKIAPAASETKNHARPS